MKMPSLIAVPAAVVLILVSTATAAEDKSAVSKPVTTFSKTAKQQPAAAPQDAAVKTVKQGQIHLSCAGASSEDRPFNAGPSARPSG